MQTWSIPKRGELIGGKYRVEREIGVGGMGCVLEAEHTLLKQRVAVKLLLPQAAALPGAAERFLREAQATAALQGEHVTRVLDLGTNPNGSVFMVMEYLSGQDLRRILRQRGPLPVAEAAEYILQACDALLEAHSLGISHRDIKPSNLFVTARPNGTRLLKVLDFGLAKVLAGDEEPKGEILTQTGIVMGSYPYMSPEQCRSLREADARSDIWSIGVVLYECLAGKRPFPGTNAEVLARVLGDQPPPLTAHRADLPEALDLVVMRCLHKRPEERPQSVAEIMTVLSPFDARLERAFSAWNAPATMDEPVTPLMDRSTRRSPSRPPPTAADEVTGAWPKDTSPSIMSPASSSASTGVVRIENGSESLPKPTDVNTPSIPPLPGAPGEHGVGGDGGEITDLSQASTRPKPVQPPAARSWRAAKILAVALAVAFVAILVALWRDAAAVSGYATSPSSSLNLGGSSTGPTPGPPATTTAPDAQSPSAGGSASASREATPRAPTSADPRNGQPPLASPTASASSRPAGSTPQREGSGGPAPTVQTAASSAGAPSSSPTTKPASAGSVPTPATAVTVTQTVNPGAVY
ncbi:MAG: protein kinase [Polyangiaceae bacterium]